MRKKGGETVRTKLLAILDREYPDSMHIKVLAQRLGTKRPYLSNVIPRLVEKGLVERTAVGYYRRKKW